MNVAIPDSPEQSGHVILSEAKDLVQLFSLSSSFGHF